jgi:hypothetical protein
MVLPTEPPTPTVTFTPTITHTPLPPTETPTPLPSDTPLPTATYTPSRVPTLTFTFTPTATDKASGGGAPAISPTPLVQLFDHLAGQVDRGGVIQTIADLQNFENRYTNSESLDGRHGIQAARDYLKSRMVALSTVCASQANFYEDNFTITYQSITTTQSNLVLEVVGTQPNRGAIVIGAHYDTISRLPRDHRDFGQQPGADDNGSGVSATLELARLYCLEPRQKTVVFVLFAAEEIRLDENTPGRVGSRQFVQNFMPLRWRVDAMLNLDTIGSATDVRGAIIDDFARIYSAPPVEGPSRQLARRIQAAAYVQMPEFRLNVELSEDRENRWGDHMSFTRAGYPAARLFEGSEDIERQDSPFDLLNDLDPPYLIRNMLVALAFILGESEGTPPPPATVNGRLITWEAVPDVQGYLLAQRLPGESNYTYTRLSANQRTIELEANTIFALGSIGSNGLLGTLSQEMYIAP